MCGVGGFFLNQPADEHTIQSIFSALSRRGPDAKHIVGWDQTWAQSSTNLSKALIHTRLSVRDLRPEADQPMSNRNKDIWVCYNGEVYGWVDDANDLKKRGHHFNTHSDTEFILHAYEEWGLDGMISKLRGMFALAILDLNKNKLFLIRDRMGLKPLLYHHDSMTGNLIFASLVRAILPLLPRSKRQFSPDGIDAYLAHRYVPAPNTIFQNIQRLENGHLITYDLQSGKLHKRQYWSPEATEDDWKDMLDDAIRIRLESDRPIGMFLSGGMDSGVIASRLSRLSQHSLPHAFTAAFPNTSWDESMEAALLAKELGIPFSAHSITMDLSQDFSRIISDLDEPFSDPSAIPTWYLSREAVKKVTVVLGGDGGDELFGGYKRYPKHLRTAWRKGLSAHFPIISGWSSKGWKKLLSETSMNWEDAYSLRFSGFTPNQRKYLQPDHKNNNHYWRLQPDTVTDPRGQILQIDMDNYLPEYILRKADLCTMSHGLEMRCPMIDHYFYQSLLSLDDKERFTTPPKSLLTSYAPETAPILKRKKRGFNPPLNKWITNDLSHQLDGLGERLEEYSSSQINARSCNRIVKHYREGHQYLEEQILQLLMLDESLSQLLNI